MGSLAREGVQSTGLKDWVTASSVMTANLQQPPQQQQNMQVSSQFLVEQQMDTVVDIHH